jgi:hypothetical protein
MTSSRAARYSFFSLSSSVLVTRPRDEQALEDPDALLDCGNPLPAEAHGVLQGLALLVQILKAQGRVFGLEALDERQFLVDLPQDRFRLAHLVGQLRLLHPGHELPRGHGVVLLDVHLDHLSLTGADHVEQRPGLDDDPQARTL